MHVACIHLSAAALPLHAGQLLPQTYPSADAKWAYQPPAAQQVQQHFVEANAHASSKQAHSQQQQQQQPHLSKAAQFARWCGMLWCTGCIWSSGATVGSQVTNAVINGMR